MLKALLVRAQVVVRSMVEKNLYHLREFLNYYKQIFGRNGLKGAVVQSKKEKR